MSRTISTVLFTVATASLALGGAGCASRTAAATQTTIKAFDPAGSEPKAVEVADQMIAALGGAKNWDNAKQISWQQGVILNGKLIDAVSHDWDRWNGRHRFTRLDPTGQVGVTMHELFSDTKFAFVKGDKGKAKQTREDTEKMATEATRRLNLDGYRLAMLFKLKDPGVHLKFSEERPAPGNKEPNAPMKVDVIQVKFDAGVGPSPGDTFYIVVDKETKMPLQVEEVPAGKGDDERSGTKLEDWVDSGGLKFATKYTNIGYTKADAPMTALEVPQAWQELFKVPPMQVPNPGELVLIKDIKVSATPEEDLYVPDVNTQ